LAARRGLSIPIVYNTSGYENLEIIRLLDGIVGVYLPDMKYDNDSIAEEYSGFVDYVNNNRRAVREMYRQVGNLETKNGIACKGLIIRHLILPYDISGTDNIFKFIFKNISEKVHISLMAQYFPAWKAVSHIIIGRKITGEEYTKAIDSFHRNGLINGWIQEYF
jgi:putative pyruvate formate lyase activating enzyme